VHSPEEAEASSNYRRKPAYMGGRDCCGMLGWMFSDIVMACIALLVVDGTVFRVSYGSGVAGRIETAPAGAHPALELNR
jgi:hypothetical protein